MYKTVVSYGYCPVKKQEYFLNITYCLYDVNQYKKHSFECAYTTIYKQVCPLKECPINKNASDLL